CVRWGNRALFQPGDGGAGHRFGLRDVDLRYPEVDQDAYRRADPDQHQVSAEGDARRLAGARGVELDGDRLVAEGRELRRAQPDRERALLVALGELAADGGQLAERLGRSVQPGPVARGEQPLLQERTVVALAELDLGRAGGDRR